MGFLDKTLLPDEQIVYRTKKHFIIFLIPVVWTIATVCFAFNSNPLVAKIAFAPGIAALLTWVNQWLNYVTADFIVTNKRIIMKEGFFTRHMNELRLATVSNITVNQGLLGQLLNYGNVIINPFGGENDVFIDIAQPFELQKETQEQLEQALKK